MKTSNIVFRFISFALIAFIIPMLFGCASGKSGNALLLSKESYCAPPVSSGKRFEEIKPVLDYEFFKQEQLNKNFSIQSRLIIHALSIGDAVAAYTSLKNDESDPVRALLVRQKIYDRLLLANMEIDAMAAELDCEGERMDQLAEYIDNLNNRKNSIMIVASIVTGALSGFAGALITNTAAENTVAIAGGAAGLVLGLATLAPKGKKTVILHQRNLLSDIWKEENQCEISPLIWFMLSEKHFSNDETSSLIQNLKKRWVVYQFGGNQIKAEDSVNFTSYGGDFYASDLKNRANMVNQLQATISSLKQNLNGFMEELDL